MSGQPMKFGYDDSPTREAFNNLKGGMHFTERFAYHLFVLKVEDGLVYFATAQGGQNVPHDCKWGIQSIESFRQYHAYNKQENGYWVSLVSTQSEWITPDMLRFLVTNGNKQITLKSSL